jgi:hypothetical protein
MSSSVFRLSVVSMITAIEVEATDSAAYDEWLAPRSQREEGGFRLGSAQRYRQ